MSQFVVEAVSSVVPAPLLWAAAGAGSCCGGLALGLYFVNPLAFAILFAEEDDEDAIQKAIGQQVLDRFGVCVLASGLTNSGVSFYGLGTHASLGCCAASCVFVGASTAWFKMQEIKKMAEESAARASSLRKLN